MKSLFFFKLFGSGLFKKNIEGDSEQNLNFHSLFIDAIVRKLESFERKQHQQL